MVTRIHELSRYSNDRAYDLDVLFFKATALSNMAERTDEPADWQQSAAAWVEYQTAEETYRRQTAAEDNGK